MASPCEWLAGKCWGVVRESKYFMLIFLCREVNHGIRGRPTKKAGKRAASRLVEQEVFGWLGADTIAGVPTLAFMEKRQEVISCFLKPHE
jgi:hypothetical protein